MADLLRMFAPPALALLSVLLIDRACVRRSLLPPGFRSADRDPDWVAFARRWTGGIVIGLILWLGVFLPLGALGTAAEFDPAAVGTPQLFLLHGLLLASVACWYVLGFGFDPRRWLRQFGLASGRPLLEVVIGLAAGAAAWVVVILVMLGTGAVLWAVGGRDLLPESPPPLVPWLAGLPLIVRLAVSASAGIGEEIFFRGFLQPRVGIPLSTGLFVVAHLSYEQPFMLLGVTLLSLVFALLVRWRQSIWAAVAAHATFDGIQLAVVIPWALRHLERGDLPVVTLLT
jgi:membrane protease YdiL (CAAX protease family)